MKFPIIITAAFCNTSCARCSRVRQISWPAACASGSSKLKYALPRSMTRKHNLKNVRPRASSRIGERTSVLKQLASIALLLIVAAAVSLAQQTPLSPQVTVIRAGRLVDVDVGRVLTSQMLLLRGGKIEAMGE